MIDVKLYNTLSKRLDVVRPVDPPTVRMYNCGPTVYDYAHIGNFRSFMVADLLRRALEFLGYDVVQVMNITDVGHMTEDDVADATGEDKMQLAMRRMREAKKQGKADVDDPNDPFQVAAYFTRAFLDDARLLGMKIADEYPDRMPEATKHVEPMIALIKRLIDNGHAYVADDGVVYYDVASFGEYGKLSGNTTDRLVAGAGGRVTETQLAGKRHPADFFLWKPDPTHVMKWDSPWGVGYPGWHIECSAMSMAVLGVETLDIHTGGEDNIFPHHECEIAQSTGATGKPFANHWLHARHLLVDGEKMSKSKGNFFTVRDLLARGADPAALRLQLLRMPYRANANFTMEGLADATKQVARLREFVARGEAAAGGAPTADLDPGPRRMGPTPTEKAIANALADDLNISAAMGELNKWMNGVESPTADDAALLRRVDGVLNLLEPREPAYDVQPLADDDAMTDEQIDAKVRQIDEARAAKDYAKSDAVRDELTAAGIDVQISRHGTTWKRKLT